QAVHLVGDPDSKDGVNAFPVDALSSAAAARMLSHQVDGSCSAQPGRFASMASSCFGDVAAPVTTPVPASRRESLIAELPTSMPNRYPFCMMPPATDGVRSAEHMDVRKAD